MNVKQVVDIIDVAARVVIVVAAFKTYYRIKEIHEVTSKIY